MWAMWVIVRVIMVVPLAFVKEVGGKISAGRLRLFDKNADDWTKAP